MGQTVNVKIDFAEKLTTKNRSGTAGNSYVVNSMDLDRVTDEKTLLKTIVTPIGTKVHSGAFV